MRLVLRPGFAGAVIVLCVVMAGPNAAARDQPSPAPSRASESGAPRAIVVEMFLSQACNACPAAEALMPEIAAQPGVIALTWHVDYWNMTDSAHGRWADPLAKAAFSDRQRRYNWRLRKRSSVYTPQAVVNGAGEAIGSSLEKISTLIEQAPPAAPVAGRRVGDGLVFSVGEDVGGGNAYLITFRRRATTHITGGENFGKTFNEINVVTGVSPLGAVLRRGGEIAAPAPAAGEACAFIVQEPKQARIVAAGLCPA